jgi:hypothetical protein
MKVDRVILAVNNNLTYTRFWDIVSKVWKNNFGITPTLVFNGTQSEYESTNLNIPKEDFIIVDRVDKVSESSPDWSVTWSLFWGASQFPNDVCILSGIDQIPLGDFFYKKILEFADDKFIVGFADAYRTYDKNTLGYFNTATNVLFPSSHLVGKGSKFKEIFDIEEDWQSEIIKVHESRSRYHLQNKFYPGKLWGLDECYSSEKISTFEKQEELVYLSIFWNYWEKNRIDFCGKINHNYNINLVKEGYYSELTTKQYHTYKKDIENIINILPKYNFE